MNIQDYISSGIIETYVLGLAGEDESLELERLCLEHPEIAQALQEAQEAMEEYAQLHAVNPSSDTKNQIWNGINQDTKPVVESSKRYLYLAIAACLLLAIGLPYHIYRVNQYKTEISTLKKEKTEIIAQNNTFQAQIQQTNEEVDILTNPSVKNIVLAGTPSHEDKQAKVYWGRTGEVFLSSGTLPSLSKDKQYQLWAIVDGKPVNAGLLEDINKAQLQKMHVIERAQMFAITIENRGGSEQPTLDQMVVAGKTF